MAGEGAERELLTQKQYARRRGWSKQYVHQLVKAGRIILEGGLIDIAAADAALARQRDPARDASLASPGMKEATETEDAAPPLAGNGQAASMSGSFVKARTVREHYRAMREKLEYEDLAGRLIARDDVEDAAFRFGAYVRESLMLKMPAIGKAIGRRYGIDASEVTELLEDGMTQVLTFVANELEAEANPFAKPLVEPASRLVTLPAASRAASKTSSQS